MNVDIALRLARAGLHVFPCTPDKLPSVRGSWRENSTTDQSTIASWWRVRTSHLVAIDLGKAELLVIDGDRHPNGDGVVNHDGVQALHDLFREHGTSLKHHPMTRSPSGGVHIYCKNPHGFGNSEGDLPKGINIRGAGGYVVAPGCVLPDGRRYVPLGADLVDAFQSIPPMPEWLAEMIKGKRADQPHEPIEREPIVITRQNGRRFENYAAAALERMAQELSVKPPESGRNIALNLTAWKMGTMINRGWIDRAVVEAALYRAAENCSLVKDTGGRSVRATLASGLDDGTAKPHPDLRDRT
jgi:hypothetical protein